MRKRTTTRRRRTQAWLRGRGRRLRAEAVTNAANDWRALVNTVTCTDALTLLASLPDGCVNLIAADPPFNIGKADWDTWDTVDLYLAWLDKHLREFRRVLTSNGSLYMFCDTRYASKVEGVAERHFKVLNNIRWRKPPFSTKAEMFDKETMRAYFPASESIIFAEQYGGDKAFQGALIDGNITYWQALEGAKTMVIGDYLRAEFNRAGITNRQIATLFPSATGGLTGCVSNWLLGYNIPTAEQYAKMRVFLNENGAESDYLRREYDDLRREYDDLRRPFTVSARDPYTDVWDFATVNTYAGKHPCEKPLDMMRHIVRASSRRGDLVLDCFAGSGATLRAAFIEGRNFIGCDMDAHWARKAQDDAMLPYDVPLFPAA